MKIETGRVYRTRGGEKFLVISYNPKQYRPYTHCGFSLEDPSDMETWNEYGAALRFMPTKRDLVEEVSKENEMEIEVGKYYRTRDGRVFKVTNYTADMEDPYPCYGFNVKAEEDVETWTEKGVSVRAITSPSDLVEEITGVDSLFGIDSRPDEESSENEKSLIVGAVYQARNGNLYQVINYDEGDVYFPYIGVSLSGIDGGDQTWEANGSWFDAAITSDMDLVKEVSRPVDTRPVDVSGGMATYQIGGEHYDKMEIEPIDAMKCWLTPEEFCGFLKGNYIKYIARNRSPEDIKKAEHYLEMLINFMENNNGK